MTTRWTASASTRSAASSARCLPPYSLIAGNVAALINQFKGVAVVIVYDAVVSLILLKIIDAVIGLRVSEETEREGLDLALHGEVVQ